MKTRIRLLISTVFILPLVTLATTAFVNAETTTDSSTTTQSETVKPDDALLLQRLATRKAALKTKLTTVEQLRIKDKCKQAQGGGVNSLWGRIKGLETSRNEVYKNLVNRLNKLNDRLKDKDVDTAKLEAEIATLQTKITTFNTDLATYKQAVTDLKGMDCVADPTAFKASLESARTLREQVVKDSTDIKAYVNDTIKPTLKEIRAQLEAAEKAESSGSTSTDTGDSQ